MVYQCAINKKTGKFQAAFPLGWGFTPKDLQFYDIVPTEDLQEQPDNYEVVVNDQVVMASDIDPNLVTGLGRFL